MALEILDDFPQPLEPRRSPAQMQNGKNQHYWHIKLIQDRQTEHYDSCQINLTSIRIVNLKLTSENYPDYCKTRAKFWKLYLDYRNTSGDFRGSWFILPSRCASGK